MKSINVVLAVCISVILIGGAIWFRISSSKNIPNEVVAVENNEQNASSTENLGIIASENQNSSSTSENLTETDLVGRQMVSDYLTMASNGLLTDQNINTLAAKYAENMGEMSVPSNLKTEDLNVVADSVNAYNQYGQTAGAIYYKYQALAQNAAPNGITGLGDEASSKTFASLSKISLQAANELKAVPVPTSLVESQLKLVNGYFELARDLDALSNVKNNGSATAYAALISLSNLSQNEDSVIGEIMGKLAMKGASFGNQNGI